MWWRRASSVEKVAASISRWGCWGGHVGFGLPCGGVVEVLAEGVVAGEGAVEFAFEGVSGDVWGG